MQSKEGSIIGSKGVTYGLIKTNPRPAATAKAPLVKKANIFGDDSDEDDVGAQIAREAEKRRTALKVQKMYEEALLQDSTVFQYDEVYDSIQQSRDTPKHQDKIQRHSKYIAQLKEQAEVRKKEQDILYERRMVRERKEEDHLFEDKEKFVTAAYRRKLEEDKKWIEQETIRDLEESRNDVRKVGHMGNFYANLLNKNVAFGAKPQPAAAAPAAAAAGGDAVREPGIPLQGSRSRDASPELQGARSSEGLPVAKPSAARSEYEASQREDGDPQRSPPSSDTHQDADGIRRGGAGRGVSDHSTGGFKAEPAAAEAEGQDAAGQTGSTVAGGEEGGSAPGGKRRNDDDAVLSARERYLARKQRKG